MTKVFDLVGMREHNEMTDFAKYLVEQGWDSHDLEPAHFCLLVSGNSSCGGGFEYTQFRDRDRGALLCLVGMLEAAKQEALKKLEELDYDGA